MKEILNLTVNGMSCSHCVNSIKKAVLALNGVDKAEVDLMEKKVTVVYDPGKANPDNITKTIENQGYDVEN